MMNCTGKRCIMQFDKVDPATCKCVSYCPQATPPKTNAEYPLVSSKHKHLIDAEALLDKFEKESKAANEHGRDFSFCFMRGDTPCAEWWTVMQMVEDAMTVADLVQYEPPKKMTNADRIRSMTDEEMADYLRWHNDLYSRYGMDWLDWLKQGVNEGET